MSRDEVWKLFGAPTDQFGSVNEPRTAEEFGLRWNEKWTYAHPTLEGHPVERVVLWNRYDLVGVFRIASDGSVEPEPLPEV